MSVEGVIRRPGFIINDGAPVIRLLHKVRSQFDAAATLLRSPQLSANPVPALPLASSKAALSPQ